MLCYYFSLILSSLSASGRANHDHWHGEPPECCLPRHGARQLEQVRLPIHVWPVHVVH